MLPPRPSKKNQVTGAKKSSLPPRPSRSGGVVVQKQTPVQPTPQVPKAKSMTFTVGENLNPTQTDILKLGLGPISKEKAVEVMRQRAAETVRKPESSSLAPRPQRVLEELNPVKLLKQILSPSEGPLGKFLQSTQLKKAAKKATNKEYAQSLTEESKSLETESFTQIGIGQALSFRGPKSVVPTSTRAGVATKIKGGGQTPPSSGNVENIIDNSINKTFSVNKSGVATSGPYEGLQLVKNGKLIPEAAKGRISDIASQLDATYPNQGIGAKFLSQVDPNNVTIKQLKDAAIRAAKSPTLSKKAQEALAAKTKTVKPLNPDTPPVPPPTQEGLPTVDRIFTPDDFGFVTPEKVAKLKTIGKVKPQTGLDVLRPVSSRLKKFGNVGEKILTYFRNADNVAKLNEGRATRLLVNDTNLAKLPANIEKNILPALEGKIPLSSLPPEAQKIVRLYQNYFKSVSGRAGKSGIKIKLRSGETKAFPESSPGYAPHILPSAKSLKSGVVRNEVLENSVRNKAYPNIQEATQALDDWIKFVESDGARGGDVIAKRLVTNGQAKTLAEARGKLLLFQKPSRQTRFGNLDYGREIDFPFYDPSIRRVLPGYIQQAEKRLADAMVYGPNLERLAQQVGNIKGPQAKKDLKPLLDSLREVSPLSDTNLSKMLQAGRSLSTFRLSPLSTILNYSQRINVLIKTDFTTFTKSIFAPYTKSGQRIAVDSGAISEGSLRQVMEASGALGKTTQGYLKKIGFTKVEAGNRMVASKAGWEWSQKLAKRLLKNPTDAFATKELQGLGINPKQVIKNKGLTLDDLRSAAKNLSDITQFRSRPADLPQIFTGSELGRIMTQFKTFAYQQGKFIADETIGLLKTNPTRAIRNITILGTIYPLTGEIVADIRSLLTGKKRTTNGLQRYFEDLFMVGAVGMFSDLIGSLKYNFAEFLVGPTFNALGQNLQKAYKLFTGKFTTSDARSTVGQIPAIGPLIKDRIFPKK